MIKVKISKAKKIVKIKAKGTVPDVCVETATMIEDIYRSLSIKHPELAKQYKNTLLGMLLDPTSPVWKGVKG